MSNDERTSILKGGWVLAGGAYFKMTDYVSIASDSYELLASTSPASPNIPCKDPEDDAECNEAKYLNASIEILDKLFQYAYNDVSAIRARNSRLQTSEGTTEDPTQANLQARFASAKAAGMSGSNNFSSSLNPEEMINSQKGMVASTMISTATFLDFNMTTFGMNDRVTQLNSGRTFASVNPYQDAISLGHGMNTIKVMSYVLSTNTTVAVRVLESVRDASNSGIQQIFGTGVIIGTPSAAAQGLLESFLPIIYMLITISSALAWALAYYIPMMPAILWITLVSAYCVIVIEAVVAAPLAIILAATPEGEGIAGQRMEQAIKMLAAVLLRPSLMIIGLFASIYIAKISYLVFLTLFWQQAYTYVGDGLFATFAIIVIYVGVLHQLLNSSLMVMDTLPSSILQWIGGGGNQEFGQKAVENMGSTVDQGGSGLTSASKEMVGEARRRKSLAQQGGKGGIEPKGK
jgi:conjugal transfer/type IV secretion protein DotA/TraY